jgi:enterochelin esterase-like enzyme
MMRRIVFMLAAALICRCALGEDVQGTVVQDSLTSASLANSTGENTTRKLSVYLPPGYNETSNRYPVIYYLHGFQSTGTLSPQQIGILDTAIRSHRSRPFIFVVSDQLTSYGGSFYANSPLTGNWADFTAKDLVAYMDAHYRTIADRNSRGICGHSMGGHGALKLAMLFPDVFCSVYALSPGSLVLVKEFGPNSDSYKQLTYIKTKEDLDKTYFPKVIVDMARTWSPNPAKPPFYCDVPFQYAGDTLIVDNAVLRKWNQNLPLSMIDDYADNLRKLKAIKLDWGRNDGSRFPLQCSMFSQKLENLGIEHFAEEYIGTHTSKIWTEDGRVLNSMLPFFNTYLQFENSVAKN